MKLPILAIAIYFHVGDGLPLQIVGQTSDKDHQYGSRWMSISPGHLDVFELPVLRRRDINENDTAAAPAVALINKALTKQYLPYEDLVGRQITVSKGLGPISKNRRGQSSAWSATSTIPASAALPILW